MRKKKIKPLSIEDQIYAKELIQDLDGTIRRVVRSYLDADLSSEFEDIVQSIYETICLQLDDFKHCDSQRALAIVIAARKVWHVHRDRKPTEVLSEDSIATEDSRGLEDILPRSISLSDKELITAVYAYQESMEDLAVDLGCPASTLRQRLKRARDRLKKALEK